MKTPHFAKKNFLFFLFYFQLSDESKARILLSLPHLTRLIRCDFLCDALGWIDYLDEVEDLQLLVNEFFPSQEYFFHEEWQIEMASRMCPFISKLFFIFHETCVNDFLVLANFEYLTDVTLFGGHFFKDRIKDLLELKGLSLNRLTLISVSGVDFRALAYVSILCPNLTSLDLCTCDLVEFKIHGNPNSDEEYERRQKYLQMAQEAHQLVTDFQFLEEITIKSKCRPMQLSFLLSKCPNIKVNCPIHYSF